MPIIVLDGPDCSGKTYVARLLEKRYGARVRHWGPITPDDRVYAEPLREDIHSGDLIVWDRSWVSEHVYAKLLGRDRRLRDNPWLGEWLHTRAVRTVGLGMILLGPDVATLERLRKDHPGTLLADAQDEVDAFRSYAERFGWRVLNNYHTSYDARDLADVLAARARQVVTYGEQVSIAWPPGYCGPPDARVVFVGDEPGGGGHSVPGSWLPFCSRFTMRYGELLGNEAFKCGWTNRSACPPQTLRMSRIKLVIACGARAQRWVKFYAVHSNVLPVPHPSWLYRWGRGQDKIVEVEQLILRTVKEVNDSG